jgi:hypothetical protein
MNSATLGLIGAAALLISGEARAMAPPPDTQPGAERVVVLCTVTAQGLSSDCRFDWGMHDSVQRLKAGSELGYLDAHPFPIAGADPGAEVRVCVRLQVTPTPDRKGFYVSGAAAPAPSGSEIRDAVWIQSPHDQWVNGFIPELAVRFGESGMAKVSCTATADGALTNCWVREETRPELGFGIAAMFALQHARMAPTTASGQPVAGRPYVQTFVFDGNGRVVHD